MVNSSNYVDYIIDFESGQLTDEQTIDLFKFLINSGLIYSLQGFYHRTARKLIDNGYL